MRSGSQRAAWAGLLVLATTWGIGCGDRRDKPGEAAPAPTKAEAAGAPHRFGQAGSAGPKPKTEAPKPSMDSTPKPDGAKNPLAGCLQCHVDIEDEYTTSVHFREKVACTECHGPSTGHLADENNEVKPDEIFAREDVDRLCGRCHECERPPEPKPVPASSPRHKVCIDCHGPHDLEKKG